MTEHNCNTCSMLATHLTALLLHDVLTAGEPNADRKAMLDQLAEQHGGVL